MNSNNQIQYISDPWLYDNLNEQQYKELFELSNEMQKVIDKELHIYILEIINQLYEEKSNATNIIDTLITNKVSNNRFNKYYFNCNEHNIENKKQVCPKCKFKLPTL